MPSGSAGFISRRGCSLFPMVWRSTTSSTSFTPSPRRPPPSGTRCGRRSGSFSDAGPPIGGMRLTKWTMTDFELSRYLDYCSEMLSLIGKVAALYVQRFDDPAALSAVDQIEDLTTGLSRKIRQNIMIINQGRA